MRGEIVRVRDASLFVKIMGSGFPVLLMHGGPGLDHSTLSSLEPLSDAFTLVFYDHRCNGRSSAPIESMSWQNLTADADALRRTLGFERWAVLGQSFGGMVALEYALRYPEAVSQLLLLDACGAGWWAQQNAPEVLRKRGYRSSTVEAARRFYSGELEPREVYSLARRFMGAYYYHLGPLSFPKALWSGIRIKMRPEAHVFGFRELYTGWTVMDRLHEIDVPSLVLAGRHDFLFPPEHQAILADRLPNAQLEIVECAGHNPQDERTIDVLEAIRRFMVTTSRPAVPEYIGAP